VRRPKRRWIKEVERQTKRMWVKGVELERDKWKKTVDAKEKDRTHLSCKLLARKY
jgi:hypothetical protein